VQFLSHAKIIATNRLNEHRTQSLELDLPTHAILREVLIGRHRFVEAEAAFRAAIILDSSSAKAWFGLGVSLVSEGNPSEGIACLEHVLKLQPDSAITWCQLGASLLGQGRADEAAT